MFNVQVGLDSAGYAALMAYFTNRPVPGAEQPDFQTALISTVRAWGKMTMSNFNPGSPVTSPRMDVRYDFGGALRSWPVWVTVNSANWVQNQQVSLSITNIQ